MEGLRHPVQHHFAHVLACLAENELENPVLGISWDGAGYGTDGTVWGGEFLLTDEDSFQRVAHFRPFRLPGGDAAIKEPRRTALGVLYEIWGDHAISDRRWAPVASFSECELSVLQRMLSKGSIHLTLPVPAGCSMLWPRLLDCGSAPLLKDRPLWNWNLRSKPDIDEGYPFEITEGFASSRGLGANDFRDFDRSAEGPASWEYFGKIS